MLVIALLSEYLQLRVKGNTQGKDGENRELTSNYTLDHGALNMSSATIARKGYVATAKLQRYHMREWDEVGSGLGGELVTWCEEMRNAC